MKGNFHFSFSSQMNNHTELGNDLSKVYHCGWERRRSQRESHTSFLSRPKLDTFTQNLTLWHGGDDLILSTANQCANTVVIMHTVGAVLVESWYDHPNVTAILSAGLPGQESGNAILDILTGTVNP